MTEQKPDTRPQFYLTAPQPCPYLTDRFERKVFTHLTGSHAVAMNTLLTHGGFRRSQNIAYRPVCDQCQACISIRIKVDEFMPDKTMRRILKTNHLVLASPSAPKATSEQYRLFKDYLETRHADGGMADMTVQDFNMMIEDTHVKTMIVEYRDRTADSFIKGKSDAPLIAAALTDIIEDGLSMVYSFYDPILSKRSLGTYLILEHILRAQKMGLPYVYLGYWVNGSEKMDYKKRFQPQEHLTSDGWRLYSDYTKQHVC